MKNLKEEIQSAVSIFKSGNLIKAEENTRKLILENPKVAFLYNLLGLILAEQKRFEEAESFYNKGIKIDPEFAMIYNNLGLLYSIRKTDDGIKKSEDFYKKTISINNNIPEPYTNLGNLYKSINRSVEAIESHKKAIEVSPKFFFAYHNLANVYVSIGKFNEAKESLKEAIKLNPNFFVSHRLLSRLTKYTANNEHFNELIKLSQDKKIINQPESKYINFALGKAYEDIKKYEKSFEQYSQGNSLFRKEVKFSLFEEKDNFESLKSIYNKELFSKFKDCGLLEKSPIFIVGMPRSGTTLIEQILSNHNDVFGADEVEFIPDLIKKNFKGHNLKIFFSDENLFSKRDFKNIGNEYISKMKLISSDSERTTDKLPNNFLFIGFIKLILPNAKIIHCQRNPEDNIFSIFKNHFTGGKINFAYDIDETVAYYNLYVDLMEHWNNTLPNFIYNLKYEGLILNLKNETSKLLNFCNLKWSENCLKFYENNRPIKTASDIQARSKIYNSSINSWKKYEKFLEIPFKKIKKNTN